MIDIDRATGLIVVDVQQGFDDPAWGERNNPDAEARIADLIAAWRAAHAPLFHVQHDSQGAEGRLRPGTHGHAHKPSAKPVPGEPLYRKRVNSAFIGTTLEQDLHAAGVEAVVVVGLTTNHCVSTTVRMAANLGFRTYVVADATATFARGALDGTMRSAEAVHAAALSDLQGEFAEVVSTQQVLEGLAVASERGS